MSTRVNPVEVETRHGRIKGFSKNGARRWLGIPYARAERFAAPVPFPAWNDVREATAMGPQCAQLMGSNPKRAAIVEPKFSEHCQVLNIYSAESEPCDPKPVLVWIHGGAFASATGAYFEGTELCKSDIVVVSINYRLGVLGWVNFGDALGCPGTTSNPGLRDVIAALEWIQLHIRAFGGDPGRVTIAGESAGSSIVGMLLHCKRAWPLFHRAIMQSGGLNWLGDRASSAREARRYCEFVGVLDGDLARLRSLPLARLFEAQAMVAAERPNRLAVTPWFDGDLLPASAAEARTMVLPDVPLIAGWCREETRLFTHFRMGLVPTDRIEVDGLVRHQMPQEHAEQIIGTYPPTKQGALAFSTDLSFGAPTFHVAMRHARQGPTWLYRFDYAHPIFGAMHALDLLFLWPLKGILMALLRGGPLTGKRARLASQMQAFWTHFVRHGCPGAEWPQVADQNWPALRFGGETRAIADLSATSVGVWRGVDIQLG